MLRCFVNSFCSRIMITGNLMLIDIKVLEKCTKNLIGHSRLAFNDHESNIDC